MLASLGGMVAGAAAAHRPLDLLAAPPSGGRGPTGGLPRKADFRIADGFTYINGAYTHPMPIVAREAYQQYLDRRSTLPAPEHMSAAAADAKRAFAGLINAKPTEIGLIANTSSGENFVVECLGIGKTRGNVVTDALHFEGALVHLTELQKKGLDLRIVMPRDGRIDLADMARVIDTHTTLVEVSFVAMVNGFQHDLKAVADLAHAHGAHVYADIIQGVGTVPLDIHATGVDFAATSSYKWLMGDFGLGFFYVKEALLGTVIERPHWSYESAPDADTHRSPFDPETPTVVTYTPGRDANSYVQLGTMAYGVGAALSASIPYIVDLGVENIQQHRQPMLRRLQDEMPRLGFPALTPRDSTSPIVSFAHKDEAGLTRKLAAARVNVRVAPYYVRVSPSVYNDMDDVERLLEALA
jgi:selenocysteine lyase/cysteine desulfurase